MLRLTGKIMKAPYVILDVLITVCSHCSLFFLFRPSQEDERGVRLHRPFRSDHPVPVCCSATAWRYLIAYN